MSSPLKWGIASCGAISHDFCNALNIVKRDGHTIAAVAARDASRAEEFAKLHHVDKFYGSYEELAKDPNIDVVYVGSIHPTHYEISKLMLTHDKHVLCEKPMTLSHEHTAELIDLAKQRKRFLMEGVWSRCSPVYEQLRCELKAGTIGKVHAVLGNFCVPVISKDRTFKKELGGSVLMDTGVYLLQFANMVFGRQPTNKVITGHTISTGVDDYMSIVLQYNGGEQVAHMICDGRYKLDKNEVVVCGEKGTMTVGDPFWAPLELVVNPGNKKYEFPLPGAESDKERPPMKHDNCGNFAHEIRHVGRCIQKGMLESDVMPHADSLHIAALMDEARNAVGVTYS